MIEGLKKDIEISKKYLYSAVKEPNSQRDYILSNNENF